MLTRLALRMAERIIASRKPDFIVGTSDDPRALHDHPWLNVSWLIEGKYVEHTIADGGIHHRREIAAGALRFRRSTFAHRVELIPGIRARSLFFTGPKLRTWGFHCRLGWRPFHEFVAVEDNVSSIGAGCGELE